MVTRTTTPSKDIPLFEAKYELSTLMTQEAASLLTPTGTTNPAYILVYLCLGALLLYALAGELVGFELNVPLMLALAIAIAALLYAAQHWQDRMRKKLAREGLDAAFLSKEDRAFEVDVFDDRVEEKSHRGTHSYPLRDLKTARIGERACVLVFPKSDVIVPKRALSASRYQRFCDFVRTATSQGQRRKET